jgi:hypothetical protein
MIVSIHQPQYLPWIPYFQKIRDSELFIILDDVTFQKNGLQNRNRIKTSQGPLWLTIPVRQSFGQKIYDVEINNNLNWKKKHWYAIQDNYQKAPAFNNYSKDLEHIYTSNWNKLIDINIYFLELMLKWLEIDVKVIKSSSFTLESVSSKRILDLCKIVGATEYLSGLGGKNYLIEEDFINEGIKIRYQEIDLPSEYPQRYIKNGFYSDLAALDLILNCGDEAKYYIK